MKWITRKNASVDRIACPWLIKRFVDADAEFLYVPAGEVMAVDLVYGDHEGGQLTITRFILSREEDGSWRPAVVRHWALEGADPRWR